MRDSTNLRGLVASSNIAAGILVGGHSTRMGMPKTFLPHAGGGTLLEYLVYVSKWVAPIVIRLKPKRDH